MSRNYWLLSAIATAAAVTTSASAQEADQGTELEEIVVTGSYLFTGLDSPSPVVVISGDQIMDAAPADLGTYFFDNVVQNNSRQPIAETGNTAVLRTRSIRTASINLRGLGSENTLVLLNGRRTIENPTPSIGGWRRVDINSLVPRIAIARTELLLDGGSALYGSDAVAGVVNTVTRNDFEGFDLAVDTRFFEEATSAKDITLAAIWGAGNVDSHVIVAIEWHETDRLRTDVVTGDLENNPNVDPLTGTGLSQEGNLRFTNNPPRGADPILWVDPDCGNPAFGAPVLAYYPSYEAADGNLYLSDNPFTGAAGTTPAAGGVVGPTEECSSPTGFNPNAILQNDTEQLMVFVAAEHRFSDALNAKVEINFSRQRFFDTETWGDRPGGAWNPRAPNALGSDFEIPVTHPGRMRAVSLDDSFGMRNTPGGLVPSPFWMSGETMPFLSELDAFQESDLTRAAFTLDGDINGDWQWRFDGSAAYSTVRNGARDMVKTRYVDAILGLGGPLCNSATGTPGEADCFYYNPFMSSALPDAASLQNGSGVGLSQTGLANDPTLVEWLTPIRTDVFEAEFYSADVQVIGSFGELPGGPIGVAVGAGSRSDTTSRNADQLVNAGLTATMGTVNDYSGRQKINNAYVELALPIRDNVNIQLAARYEDYVGSFSDTSPKIAALWTPTDDLVLRASWGQSFKAPGIIFTQAETTLQGGGRERVSIGGVTYGGRGGIRGLFRIFPNPDLLPQKSDNWSLGFDYNATDNISFGATYVGIEFTDRISNPTTPQVVSDINCIYTDANGIPITSGAGLPEDRIQWNVFGVTPTPGNIGCMIPRIPDPTFTPIGFRDVTQIVGSPINLGYLNAEYLDLRASMFWDTAIGMLSFTPNVSIVTKYEYPRLGTASADVLCPPSGDPTTTADDVCDGVGREAEFSATSVQAMPRWQGTFTAGLSFGDHNVRLTAFYTDGVNIPIGYDEDGTYLGDLTDDELATFIHNDGLWTLDLNWFWRFNAASSLNMSVRNLFAEDPPITNSGNNSFFNRNRRTYSVQFTQSFGN